MASDNEYLNPDRLDAFDGTERVRLLITGLALCRLSNGESIFRFLTHVENHTPTIAFFVSHQNGSIKRTDSRALDADERVEIRIIGGGAPTDVVHHGSLTKMASLGRLHGGRGFRNRANPAVSLPARVKIRGASFYEAGLTERRVTLTDRNVANPTTDGPKTFCRDLGGYLEQPSRGALEIWIGRKLWKNLDSTADYYEIRLVNHCSTSIPQEDFSPYYDLIADGVDAYREFYAELEPEAGESGLVTPHTGACLPACENCEP